MAVVVAWAGTACRKHPEVVVQQVMNQALDLAAKGNVEGALAALQQAYDDKAYAPFRQQLFGALLQVNLSANRVEAAQILFKDAVARNPDEAGALVGMIEESLFKTSQFVDLATWCNGLRTLGLKEMALATVAEYHAKALEQAGKKADLIAVLPDYLARLPENVGLNLIERRFNVAAGAHDFANAEALVALLSSGPASPARTGLTIRLRVDLLIAQGKLAEAVALFKGQAGQVPEDAASIMLSHVVQTETQAGKFQDVDDLCRFVLDTLTDRTAPRKTAAGLWVDNVQGDGDVAAIVDRLTAIRKDGCAPDFVAQQIDRHYGTIMAKGTQAEFVPLLELCQALAPGLQNDDRARMAMIRLDLCFYLERFADALAIVEQGIPGRDAQWSHSLACKIKAHLCLQQGKPREAVAHFREFMSAIARDQAEQIDPLNGTRVTKDMILGLNARRIGDILAGDGDPEGAAKAYQEARDDYTRALASFKEGSPEYTQIMTDRAAIPGEGR